MIEKGQQAPDAEVLLSDGTGTRLTYLWAERPVALVFLRHFG